MKAKLLIGVCTLVLGKFLLFSHDTVMLIWKLANINMKTVTIIIILLVSNFCRAQLESENKLSYYGELSKEANKEYRNSSYQVIDLDSLFNFIFSKRKAHVKMDTSSYWKVLFEISTECSHSVSREQQYHSFDLSQKIVPLITKDTSDVVSKKKTSIPQKKIKVIYDSSKVYYGKELFLGLEIDSMFLNNAPKPLLKIMWNHDTDSLKDFPQIYERNDPLNGIWTPIICGDYMILRLVHSYPDGNDTSFYNERLLYFKKENH